MGVCRIGRRSGGDALLKEQRVSMYNTTTSSSVTIAAGSDRVFTETLMNSGSQYVRPNMGTPSLIVFLLYISGGFNIELDDGSDAAPYFTLLITPGKQAELNIDCTREGESTYRLQIRVTADLIQDGNYWRVVYTVYNLGTSIDGTPRSITVRQNPQVQIIAM